MAFVSQCFVCLDEYDELHYIGMENDGKLAWRLFYHRDTGPSGWRARNTIVTTGL